METRRSQVKSNCGGRIIDPAPDVSLDFREAGGELGLHDRRLDEAKLRRRAVGQRQLDHRLGSGKRLNAFARRAAQQRPELGMLEVDCPE